MQISKGAADYQGEGAAYSFSTADNIGTRQYQVSFTYEGSANFTLGEDSDIQVYFYNGTTITSPTAVYLKNQNYYSALVDLPENVSARLCLHVATTDATAYTLDVDNVDVRVSSSVLGLAGSNIQDCTVSGTWVANTTYSCLYSRIGDKATFDIGLTLTGAPTSSNLRVDLPSGFTIDTNKLNNTTADVGHLGVGTLRDTGTAVYSARVTYYDTDTVVLKYTDDTASGVTLTTVDQSSPFTWANTDEVSFRFIVPISGWDANVTMGAGSTFLLANVLANGTQITNTDEPDALGEFKVYTKGAGAASGSVDATSAPVTSADGIHLYAVNYASAGTAGQPNRLDAFIGKGKQWRAEFYGATGKATRASAALYQPASTIYSGADISYSVASGILTIDYMNQGSGVTSRRAGLTFPDDGGAPSVATDLYVDVIISENALAVGIDGVITSTVSSGMQALSATCTDTGTPAIEQQDGSWLSAINDDGTGDYSLDVVAGTFSVKPNCVCSNSDSNQVNCNLDSISTSSIGVNIRRLDTGAAVDGGFSIICMGTK
jgi:hypothetical protein